MIAVDLAEKLVLEKVSETSIADTDLLSSYSCILKEDIHADRDNPPFNRVTMDGIAINYSSYLQGNKSYKIEDTQKAGEVQKKLLDSNNCLEVMTGCVLPLNCNCVIKIEDIDIDNGYAHLKSTLNSLEMQNIHIKGTDYKKDQILIKKNTKILSTHTGIIASVGKSKVKVAKNLSFAIVSTGDELIEPGKTIDNHQIYMSNSYAINNAVKSLGDYKTQIFHIIDDQEILSIQLKNILDSFDVIILSGGVSMGKFDYLPDILQSLNVKNIFHKVKQKPGKPLWFGMFNNKPVFALPGNPVSALICFYKYIKPFITKSMSDKVIDEYVILNEDFTFKKDLTCFQPVKINNVSGSLIADIVKINTSGDYFSLSHSDGFIELPGSESFFQKGYIAKFFRW